MLACRGLGRRGAVGAPLATGGLGLVVLVPEPPVIAGPAFGGVGARIQRDTAARLRARLVREDNELLELISLIVRVLR